MNRARITITDLIYILLALVAIGALWPVFATVLEAAVPFLNEGEQLIFTTMLPVALVVLLTVIYVEAKEGIR